MQAEATIYFGVWWVLFEYNSFDHFPKTIRKILHMKPEENGKLEVRQSSLKSSSLEEPILI